MQDGANLLRDPCRGRWDVHGQFPVVGSLRSLDHRLPSESPPATLPWRAHL